MLKKNITDKILKNSNSYNFYKTNYEKSLENDKKYKKTIKVLEEENNELKQKITSNKQLNNKIEVLTNENKSLKKNMASFNQVQEKLENANKQNSQTSNELKTLKEEKTLLKKELSTLNTSNKQLNDEIQKLNKTNQELLKINNENKEQMILTQKQAEYSTIKIQSKYNQMERFIHNELSQFKYIMTIIIPFYNSGEYIEQCFLSILKQSLFNKIEIIFVDDCSTDNSLEIVYKLRENYKNIRVFKTEENSGYAGKPRNIGLKYASTDYVLFLDSDDALFDNACQALLEKIISTDADMVTGLHEEYFGAERDKITRKAILIGTFSDKSKTMEERIQEAEKLLKDHPHELVIKNINEYPLILNTYTLSSKLFNKKFIQENNITFPENVPAEDSYFIFKSLICSKKTVCIYNPIYTYNRALHGSVSYTPSQESRLGRLKSYNMMYELSIQKNVDKIFTEVLLGQKINYFLTSQSLNLNLSDKEYIEIFKNGQKLFKILLEENHVFTRGFNELFTKIIEEDYEEAISVSKSLKKNLSQLKLK